MSKVWKETAASEMRISLIDSLNKYQVGFNEKWERKPTSIRD